MNWELPADPSPTVDEQPDTRPSFLSMVKLVAISVAVTILVFFAIGYIFGRLFL
jgi:hypothetical protein